MRTEPSALQQACEFWQSGQANSSLLRGAARALTGVPHYFEAEFITNLEEQARNDATALERARTLMDALELSDALDATGWATESSVVVQNFAGRGLAAKGSTDRQIEDRLDSGRIDMPLWGVTLDRKVTEEFGSRFLLEIVGPFPAVVAWMESGIKSEEQELITGGCYEVAEVGRTDSTTHAKLRWMGALGSA